MARQEGAAPPPRGWKLRPEKPLPSHPHSTSVMGKVFGGAGACTSTAKGQEGKQKLRPPQGAANREQGCKGEA